MTIIKQNIKITQRRFKRDNNNNKDKYTAISYNVYRMTFNN